MHWIKIITTNQKRSVLLLLTAQNCKRIYMRHMNFHFSLFVKPVHSVFRSRNKKLIALQNRIYDTPWSSNNKWCHHEHFIYCSWRNQFIFVLLFESVPITVHTFLLQLSKIWICKTLYWRMYGFALQNSIYFDP